MPHSVASDLGMHCLPKSHKKDARLIWVKKPTLLHQFGWLTFCMLGWVVFQALLLSADFFKNKFFQEHYQSIKQFGSRSDWTIYLS